MGILCQNILSSKGYLRTKREEFIMGAYIHTERTGYYHEMSLEERDQFMNLTLKKFLPYVDSLYFTVYIQGDCPQLPHDNPLFKLIKKLEAKKEEASSSMSVLEFSHGLLLTLKTFHNYNLCLTEPDLYDIFSVKICRIATILG